MAWMKKQMIRPMLLRRCFHIGLGIVIGFIITLMNRSINYESFKNDILFQLCPNSNTVPVMSSATTASQSSSANEPNTEQPPLPPPAIAFTSSFQRTWSVVKSLSRGYQGRRRLLLVGVMTANKFIHSRAKMIHQTWARDLDGHVIYFSSESSS